MKGQRKGLMSKGLGRVGTGMAAWLVLAAGAAAEPVAVSGSMTIGVADTMINGVPLAEAQITVSNGTLTINGEHTIRSLVVGTGGVVTHTAGQTYTGALGATAGGFHLIVMENVVVGPAGWIGADARGFGAGLGAGAGNSTVGGQCAGGGGYGGSGGNGTFVGGGTYGSFREPRELGSGGGSSGTVIGRAGGGSMRLSITGSLTLDGTISADGDGSGNDRWGCGSGGSIWISAATVNGGGTIRANGGRTNYCGGGAGGGGRVAIYGDLSSFNSASSAIQARGAAYSGAGTVYKSQPGQRAQLIFDNGGAYGQSVQSVPLVVPAGIDVIVRSGAALSHEYGSTSGLTMEIADNLTIEATGYVDVGRRGRGGSQGTGAGGDANAGECAGGGGHGGSGGNGHVLGGGTYGSFAQPTTLGSGGGASGTLGGLRGGGALRLTVGGTLNVQGEIAADGDGSGNDRWGAGAGGSLWITAGTVTGSGTIHANGGRTNYCGSGAGGGGRVAVYGNFVSFNSSTSAIQSRGAANSGAGTVYRAQTGQPAQLIFDNGGAYGQSVQSTAMNVPTGVNVIVRNGAALSHEYGDTAGLTMNVAGNLTVDATGYIDVGGRGFGGGQGPGAGTDSLAGQCAGGGGHGGNGGSGHVAGGGTYGSATRPTDLGSGGGASGTLGGLRGGGAMRLSIGGSLVVNGHISADGSGSGNDRWGSGSGGSIWITAGVVSGTGTIHADGGRTNYCGSGAGAGGRVAVYACTNSLPVASMTADGGGGNAQAGSVRTGPIGIDVMRTIVTAGNACRGATVVLSATTVAGTNYFWMRNGVAISDGPGVGGSSYSGTGTATLTITNASSADGLATFSVGAMNVCGEVASDPFTRVICSADTNCDGAVSLQDIFDFLGLWFASDVRADISGAGGVTLQDLFDFLNGYFGGCQN
ncbi:MAG: hypothetical protein IT438_12055 [Phycisphaerales bacterium]|nr:hypothetical protein [Phycisphaerales bacterium]